MYPRLKILLFRKIQTIDSNSRRNRKSDQIYK